MSWTLHRWTWLLEGPLFVGFAPSGTLNRCRIYVPARALWGALTAEAARQQAVDGASPAYDGIGQTLKKDARFTYLYPAEHDGKRWVVWLPSYEQKSGLCWRREDGRGNPWPDRDFRRRLLTTRPGTAIDPGSDSAADGSLRETECMNDRWREATDGENDRVALVGYVFTRTDEAKNLITKVERLFLGGDTRYGLGRVRRDSRELANAREVFGSSTNLAVEPPQVECDRALAHATATEGASMTGALELVGGWEWDRERHRSSFRTSDEGSRLWQPGSQSDGSGSWTIEPEGIWRATEAGA